MIKNFINNIKLTRLSYLLEIIEVRDFKSKIVAYNKIKKMKITKEMGLMILDDANYDHTDEYSDFNISLSLISLVFNDYYDEYTDKIKEIFPKLTNDSKYEIAALLSSTNNESAIKLYKKLILKYFVNMGNIPVGSLSINKDYYSLLFPDFFKTFNFDIERNNVLLLFNDYLNNGVVLEKDIKKHKKVIQTAVIDILKQGCNFKFAKNENYMQNLDYVNLRLFLEAAINIEFYVSNKSTQSYLDKLYKKKDNQLKLFILDNYVRKGKDISKHSFLNIAKDNLSRYPLYSFLSFYNLERLMPKKYCNNVLLAESDLYINYCVNTNYSVIPFDLEFVQEKIIDDYKYYFFKFKTNFNYYNEVQDPTTDYILKTVEVDKTLIENTCSEYLGISGGFNKDLDASLIEKNIEFFRVVKLDKDIEVLINELSPIKSIIPSNITKKTSKFKSLFKKKNKTIEPETIEKEEKVVEEAPVVEEVKEKKEKVSFFTKIKSLFKKKDKKVTKVKEKKKEKVVEIEEPTKEELKVEKETALFFKILRKIFSLNTLLIAIFIIFAGCTFVLSCYLLGYDLFDMKKNSSKYELINVSKSEIERDKYTEIMYNEIYTRENPEYYVLFYKKKDQSEYHTYINDLVDNDYIIYYVDINRPENAPITVGNETGFVIHDETLLKVKDKEYSFYVIGKNNILREFKDYLDSIEKEKQKKIEQAEEEAKLKKQKAEEEKKAEAKKKASEKAKEIEEKNKPEEENKEEASEEN